MELGPGHIELAGVVKTFDGFINAVDGVNLKIPNGAYCCLLGPSGCGKTTILRMIAGHDDPTAGEILIGGENVVGLPPVARRTAMMFQSYALFPHLSVRDNIAFALQVRGFAKAERRKAADAMMEKVRLTEFADRLPAQLSGGQQQRVALARAAITEPRVQLLDEPLSALDEFLRIQMRQELRHMQRELGITLNAQHFGHLLSKVRIALFQVVSHFVRFHLFLVEDLAHCALGEVGEARMSLRGSMLASVAGQKPRCPQFVGIAKFLRLPARQRHQPCLGLGVIVGSLPGRGRSSSAASGPSATARSTQRWTV